MNDYRYLSYILSGLNKVRVCLSRAVKINMFDEN